MDANEVMREIDLMQNNERIKLLGMLFDKYFDNRPISLKNKDLKDITNVYEVLKTLSLEQYRMVLSMYRFDIVYKEESDGSVTATVSGFDLVVNEADEQKAVEALIDDIICYSRDYVEKITLYFNAINRREHLPFVLNVLLQDDKNGVRSLINLNE